MNHDNNYETCSQGYHIILKAITTVVSAYNLISSHDNKIAIAVELSNNGLATVNI